MRYWLVMPAAGAGRRFGAERPKQYAPLLGRTVIEWALAPFLADARCAQIVIALAAEDVSWQEVAGRLATAAGRIRTVVGGAERSLSVRRALGALEGHAAAGDWVLVHDAARPCLAQSDLESLISDLGTHPLGGLLATPLADTLKQASPGADPEVAQTLERAGLYRALTPQMFRFGQLCAALDAAHAASRFPTDEAQALEWRGARPRLVTGLATNVKVTTAADLVIAAGVLQARHA
ncbi:MAG TPA: 2-C-methyl-D-erythritol 4-phosphate cytidylyltransferase [Steroidobacteraceae bacterium]|nr:2-C-methyl-D-erythritol 4-phosphate cytidylyltransferase [Steroidobacteraceae bacterium]